MTTVPKLSLVTVLLVALGGIFVSTYTSNVDPPPRVRSDTVTIQAPYFQKHIDYRMRIAHPDLMCKKLTGIRTYCSCISAEIVDDPTLPSSERVIRLVLDVNQSQPVGPIRYSLLFDDSSTIEVKKVYQIVYGFETLPSQEFLFLKSTRRGRKHGAIALRNNHKLFSRTANIAITRNGELVSRNSIIVPCGHTKTFEINIDSNLVQRGTSHSKMALVITVSELPTYKHTYALYFH